MDHQAHNAVAAAFSDREIAHACYEALDREGFPHRWMAVTKPAQDESRSDASVETASENDVVESSDGALGAIGRFFSGEGNSLRRSLEDHGIPTDEAIAIDEALHMGGAVIVVAAHERPEIAASILRQGGGRFYGAATGETRAYDVDADSGVTVRPPMATPVTTESDLNASVPDATQMLELREERLQIDKHTVDAGAATVGKRVVSQAVSVDVPVAREELFVERRAVDNGRVASGTIGDDETIHVPLAREQVMVEKVPVVREEVVVGQKRVESVEHVEATLRREELVVDDPREATQTM